MRGKRSGQPASLWELMNKDSLRQSQEKVIEQFTKDNVDPGSVKSEQLPAPSPPVKVPVSGFHRSKSRRKPTVRYKGLAIVALVIIIAIVIAFNRGGKEPEDGSVVIKNDQPDNTESGQERAVIAPPYRSVKVENKEIEKELEEKAAAAEKDNDHLIVITVYQVKRDLEPVQAYFRDNGILTEIVKPSVKDSKFYYLVTKKKYQSPERKGTDGYYALANIKRVGAKYKAPRGYEPFSNPPFQDAYGVNFKKSSIFKDMF